MEYEMKLLLQEIKRCRQKMYNLKPESNDLSTPELVKQSQMLDKLIFYYQKSALEKVKNDN